MIKKNIQTNGREKMFCEARLLFYEVGRNISIPPMQVDKNDELLMLNKELIKRKKILYDKLQNTKELNAYKLVLSQIQDINTSQNNKGKYITDKNNADPDFKGSKAKKDIYMKKLIEKISEIPNPILINSPLELEAIMEFGETINRPGGLAITLGVSFQNASLHLNPGTATKEININGSPEFIKKKFDPPLIIDGKGISLKEFNLFHVDGVHLKNMILQKNPTDLKAPNKYGVREDRLIRMNDVANITIENIEFKGVPLDIDGLKKGKIEGIAGAHKGILIQGGSNVEIKKSKFTNLFHAIECIQVQGGSVSDNYADIIVSDFITGGGFKNMTISGNHLGLRIPIILGKNKDGTPTKVHSDFIQLYTAQGQNSNWDMKNENVTIEGNTEEDPNNNKIYQALLASPEARKYMIGVQGILVGDENKVGNNSIIIKNNTLYNNQNNAITIADMNANLEQIKNENIIHIYENPNDGNNIAEKNATPKIRKMDPQTGKPVQEIIL